ncbi:MAG: 2-deoxy-D-gluconate 3-dehydrogenase [Microbacteriaceae bacterium]|nr:2-deoxy-D-gluconate 3-dehydrogenase [Microbacteriaceae bacterium]
MSDFRLDGGHALVTGASRGLGLAIADELHSLGATVHGTSRDPASAATIAERWGTAPVVLDVTDPVSSAAAIDALFEHAPIDLLVNNAGTNRPQAAVDVDPESWDAVYDANVRGLFFVSQAVARHWIAGGIRGSIVNVGSQTGRVAIEDRAAYGSSKAAVEQLTRALALEWAPGIRVNAVAPTFVRTELTESTLSRPDVAERLLGRIPLGRFGEPSDVAGAVAFLLGDAAALITGHTLVIDGGYTIR